MNTEDILKLLRILPDVVPMDQVVSYLKKTGWNPSPEAFRRLAKRAKGLADNLERMADLTGDKD